MNSKFNYASEDIEINKVIKNQDDELKRLLNSSVDTINTDEVIASSKSLLKQLGYEKQIDSIVIPQKTIDKSPIIVRDWNSIVEGANVAYPNEVVLEDIFSPQEMLENSLYMTSLRRDFYNLNKLDKWDYSVAGIMGTIAALLDYFFVTKVNLKTKEVTSGAFKSGIEKLWDKVLPPDVVSKLEQKYKVPFDISTNTSKIAQDVLGLNPKTHRFQSLGHDPLLGFIFGIKDLMKGTLTAIDGNGRLIIQSVSGANPISFIQAVISEFGHLLSDINAASPTGMKLSIPAPLTPLLQMIHCGSIDYKGKSYTIGDLSKRMYYDGYNFNQFIGMSIPVVIIEIVVRLYATLRGIFSEEYLKSNHKNDIMLFIANSILCVENVGKLVITKNPFAINYVSWISTAKYSIRTMKYVLIDYKLEQLEYVQKIVNQEFNDTYHTVCETWDKMCMGRTVITL